MRIKHSDQIINPLKTPTGEIIFELIGKASGDLPEPNHSLARVVIPPGKSSEAHFHKLSQESYFILEGEAQMRIDEESVKLHPGQACLIEPGEVHQISNPGIYDLVFLAVCVPAWVPEDAYPEESRGK